MEDLLIGHDLDLRLYDNRLLSFLHHMCIDLNCSEIDLH
jgi:hypothetical protein